MSNEIATTQAFQERMFAKIRDQMGDLMTDDDLKKLVESAMQKAFFEPRVERSDYGRSSERPPLFVEMLEKQMREQVGKAVSDWVAEHPEEVQKLLTQALEKGMFGMALSYFEQKTSFPLQQLMMTLQQKGVL